MQRVSRKPYILFVVLGFSTSFSGWSQGVSTSELKGTIQDRTNAPVPYATVQLSKTNTGVERTVISGPDGLYQFLALPVGEYRLEITKPGFTTYSRTGIVLQVASNTTLDVTLTLGSRSERITVEADTPMVEARIAGIGQVIDSRRIVDLPLIGRNMV